MQNLDFTYAGTIGPNDPKPLEPRPCFLGQDVPTQAAGLWYAGQIERWAKRETWKDHIATIPEEHRERAASYLRDRWRIINNRERIEQMGKKSAAGDRAMAELRKRYGNLP